MRARGVRVRRVLVRCLLWALGLAVCLEVGLRVGTYILSVKNRGGTAAGEYTILCIGDSFTYGINVLPQQKYPAVLERMLNARSSGRKYRVVNLGRPGSSTGYVLASLDEWIESYHPQLVLIMSGWNCNDYDFAEYRTHGGRGAGLVLVRVSLFFNRLKTYRLAKYLVARLQSVPTESVYPRVVSMELYDFRDYQNIALENLGKISEKLRRAGVPAVFLTYPQALPPKNPYTDTEYYHYIFGKRAITEDDYLLKDRHGKIAINTVIEYVARSYGIPLADNAAAFSDWPDSQVILPDDHHPNAAGNRLIARTVLQALESAGMVELR